jgi:hypothetical protein
MVVVAHCCVYDEGVEFENSLAAAVTESSFVKSRVMGLTFERRGDEGTVRVALMVIVSGF